MLRALRGEEVERPPVWMMRQAGRYMKVYQELCKKHTTFRERSENVDIAVEVSLQPWRAFQPDGVILFSDILTPITGMNIPFDITAGKGPVIADPIRTMAAVDKVTPLNPDDCVPFVGEALRRLRAEVGNASTVLGFVGAPFTLATYIVEGGMSKNYTQIKKLMFSEPAVLHALLQKLADAVVTYIKYQHDNGAQVVQIFDSWAAQLSPMDYDIWCAPYLKHIIAEAKKQCPDLPIILYISNSGALVERMAACNPDIISLCHTVDMKEGIQRGGTQFAYQGNMDAGVLFGSKEMITQRVRETAKAAKEMGVRHVMNTGHGVMVGTPEENVEHFFRVAKELRYADL
ncbi:uroporphyrinogen decarboxylase [Micractinium conductrix]|uniref:Uroporphyrinogen decarboxylase n=1 Tax=Micractinium conductrix TaxID=554055 RepID=A0A2P6VHS9_9CHLO|nr:uroporphyrinogen decarboxylase [Micractinium conductrix]|eukprot:PSC73649.1 uroporphyrinogen decarboxylase [Micractinium conductrix]